MRPIQLLLVCAICPALLFVLLNTLRPSGLTVLLSMAALPLMLLASRTVRGLFGLLSRPY